MEHLLFGANGPFLHNVFKYVVFQRSEKAS